MRPRVTSRRTSAAAISGLLPAAFLMTAALMPGSLACTQTRPCRAGTLWLSIHLKGTSAAVDSLSIAVSVNAAPPKTSTLPFPAGQTSGAVEVQFPNGYPAGNSGVVSVTAFGGAAPLAQKSLPLTFTPSCSTLEMDLDFGVDAGSGDASSATGGAVAIGGHGTGGAAGAGGGVGGVGGAAGSFSATGGRGTGGISADAGTDRPCVARGPEDCYDGVDNDCNGKTDCEDDVCYPVAQCEPFDPALGIVGTSVAVTASCPPDAKTAQLLNSGLTATGCSGCGCAIGTATVKCTASLYSYATSAECGDSAAPGQPAGVLDRTQGCQTPAWPASVSGPVFGVRADVFQTSPVGSCVPTGTPTKGTPAWSATTKFCGIPSAGSGCVGGGACVPRPVVASGPCMLLEGAQTCPPGLKQTRWFTDYVDGRTCGACSCGAPEGGDCSSTLVAVGNDRTCPDPPALGFLYAGHLRLCVSDSPGVNPPSVIFSGAPVAPTCRATPANMTGALTPTGPRTLCCL